MQKTEIEVTNEDGLHARPASILVKTAAKYTSSIKIVKDDLEIDGKSILGAMSLAAEKGSKIVITTDGEDEKEAIQAIVTLFQTGFVDIS